MKVYTKTGDTGETSLYGGSRVKKYNTAIEVVGVLDELNSWLGLLISHSNDTVLNKLLQREQNHIFRVGSYVAMITDPKKREEFDIDLKLILQLENEIDTWEKSLSPLKQFILPGGNKLASEIFLIRTIVRRAERLLVRLNEEYDAKNNIVRYVNRLSDWMFVFARYQNNQTGVADIPWRR